jgi:hypothetical protein
MREGEREREREIFMIILAFEILIFVPCHSWQGALTKRDASVQLNSWL